VKSDGDRFADEAQRVLDENARREREIDSGLYAPWNPAEALMRESRRRVAARLLHRHGVFPRAGDPVLEIGFGRLGWLADLLGWGLRSFDLHGIELDEGRVKAARAAFSEADLRVGDAASMAFADSSFKLVVASTVFTSILDRDVRTAVSEEIRRVLRPRGAVLWYDFRVDNPANPNVKGISRLELRSLFRDFDRHIRSLTLAPPIARRVAPLSWSLATLLESVPLLRTHLLGVFVRRDDA
jgi:ubiquinone/menaquinone biosynthesis C-methylase UbiE